MEIGSRGCPQAFDGSLNSASDPTYDSLIQLPERVSGESRQQILLTLEVPVRGVMGDPSPAGDFAQRKGFRANLSNQLESGFEQRSP